MTIGGTQEHKIEHDEETHNQCPEQQPLFFRHWHPLTVSVNYASNSSAVGPSVHLIDKPRLLIGIMPRSATGQESRCSMAPLWVEVCARVGRKNLHVER